MVKLLARFAASALGIWVAVRVIDGLAWDGQWQSMLLIVVVLGVINAIVRPIAKLLSLPVVILSLGLFILVINALMLQLTIAVTGDALTSTGFGATFLGALVISIVSWVASMILPDDDD